ncbi:MAG: tetratricopeptide repeat protein [Acidobacteria bacterium]|nr:tetratricopeptide repeat protein [Acidobacteriota bacterium]
MDCKKGNHARLVFLTVVLSFILMPYAFAQASKKITEKRGGDTRPTEAEQLQLPAYCKARFELTELPIEVKKQWEARLGKDFIHVHHYCYALNSLNRLRLGIGDPEYLLEISLNNLDYMIEHVRPNFVLLPEIYYNKGRTLMMMGKYEEAAIYFNKAKSLQKK